MLRTIRNYREQAAIKRDAALEQKCVELTARAASIKSYNDLVRARDPLFRAVEFWMPEN